VRTIRDWEARYPDQIRLIGLPPLGNIGVVRSYSSLLEASSADYVMLADQDDIWLPEKVRLTLKAMKDRELEGVGSKPILVHTDLTLVDEDLRPLALSFWRYQGLAPGGRRPFSRIMVENIVWGCTAMLNRSLVDTVGRIPATTEHHDWWIALVAAAFGDIVSLEHSHILWRRHGFNKSEVSNIWSNSLHAMKDISAAKRKLDYLFSESRRRVKMFLDCYGDRLSSDNIAAAEAFLNLPRRGFFERRIDIFRYGLFFGSRRRNAGLLALL
jgi:hypothetical protein